MTPYEYFSSSIPEGVVALNVGWLEAKSYFPRGEASSEFLDALGLICQDEFRMKTRGWHRCQLTDNPDDEEYPVEIQVGNERVCLGGAEVRVVAADGEWLIAPDLVYHYIATHGYLPPDEFIEAVIARRTVVETR